MSSAIKAKTVRAMLVTFTGLMLMLSGRVAYACIPDPPFGLTATYVTGSNPRTIHLAWDSGWDNIMEFHIFRSPDGSNWDYYLGSADWDQRTFDDQDGLVVGNTYYYIVVAVGWAGDSDHSNVANALVLYTPPPSTPPSFTASALSGSQIVLQWISSSGATGYRLERSTTNAAPWTVVSYFGANGGFCIDSGLTDKSLYYYRVFATNSGGESAPATANCTTPLAAPDSFTATNCTTADYPMVHLAWMNRSVQAGGFLLERSFDGVTDWTPIQIAQNPGVNQQVTYDDQDGLSFNTIYYYRVRAYYSTPDTLLSDICSASSVRTQIPAYGPSSPTDGLTFKNSAGTVVGQFYRNGNMHISGSVHLYQAAMDDTWFAGVNKWKIGSGSNVKLVLLTEDSGAGEAHAGDLYLKGSIVTDGPGSGDPFLIKAGGTPIASVDSSGNLHLGGKLIAAPLTLTMGSMPQNGNLTLNWTGMQGSVDGYQIWRSTSPDFPNTSATTHLADVTGTASSYTDTKAQYSAGQVYYYRIRVKVGTAYYDYSPVLTASSGLYNNPSISVKTISGTFPTPSYYKNLPDNILQRNGIDGINLQNLSAMQLESLHIYRPNMTFIESSAKNKLFFWAVPDPVNHPEVGFWVWINNLYGANANDTGGDFGRPTFDISGRLYMSGTDSHGWQTGDMLFNRRFWNLQFPELNPGFPTDWNFGNKCRIHWGRLTSLVPGIYQNMTPALGDVKAEIMAWHQGGTKMDFDNLGPTNGTSARNPLGALVLPASGLAIGGAYYMMLDYGQDPTNSYPNWDVLKSVSLMQVQHADTFSPTSIQGDQWGEKLLKPRTQTQPQAFVDLKIDNILTTSTRLWDDYRFVRPYFIQYGLGYADYEGNEPDLNAVKNNRVTFSKLSLGDMNTTKSVYLYAVSPHSTWWNEDNLYLGRCLLSFKKNDGTDHVFGRTDPGTGAYQGWEFYCGLDADGNPKWTENLDYAKSILHSRCDIGDPSIIYEKNTGLYLLATFNDGDSPNYSKVNNQYFIWAARKPWGPWRKIFTNDYNGLQYRSAQDIRFHGGGGYSVGLLPKWIEYSNVGGTGKLKLWLVVGGFWNHQINYDRTGKISSSLNDGKDMWLPWDEPFKQQYYATCFQQIELDISTPSSVSTYPAVAKYSTPDLSMEGPYDHWGVQNYFTGQTSFTLSNMWFGAKFQVGPNPIKVTNLGRYYKSGNKLDHRIIIVEKTGGTLTAKYDSTVGMYSSPNTKPGFDASDKVAADGFVYSNTIQNGPTLAAGGTYYILSQEGINGYNNHDNNPLAGSVMEDCRTANALERTGLGGGITGFVGYRFKTGPLGLRVTHAMRLANNNGGAVRFIIQKVGATTNTTSLSTVVNTTINAMGLIQIGDTYFYSKKLDQYQDLEPLTEYFVGIQISPGDKYYCTDSSSTETDHYLSAKDRNYDQCPKARMNPNMLQFLYPAFTTTTTLANTPWYMLGGNDLPTNPVRPTVEDGEKYDDGVGILPPVIGPVNFSGEVPDRFEGFRRSAGYNNQTVGDSINIPYYNAANSAAELEILNAVFMPSTTSTMSVLLGITCSSRNTCFGPLNICYDVDGGSSNKYLLPFQNETDNILSDWNHNYNSTKFFDPVQGKSVSGFAGMQIKPLQPITIKKIGRYFSAAPTPLPTTNTLRNRRMILTDSLEQGNVLAEGTITPGTTAGFYYADMYQPGTQALPNKLQPGITYYILSYEDAAMSTDLPYGLYDDFSQVESGSSIQFMGPAFAQESGGNPVASTLKTISMNASSPDTPAPLMFGPLNMLYDVYNSNGTAVLPMKLFGAISGSVTTSYTSGSLGIKLKVGAKPVMVTELGRYKVAGNTKKHKLIIQKTALSPRDHGSPSVILASVVVDNINTADSDGYVYAALPGPCILEAGQEYYIGSYEENNGDRCLTSGGTNTQGNAYGLFEGSYFKKASYTESIGQWTEVGGTFASNVNIKFK